jgi:hypothetical protein
LGDYVEFHSAKPFGTWNTEKKMTRFGFGVNSLKAVVASHAEVAEATGLMEQSEMVCQQWPAR